MKEHQWQIGIFGTFDVENYGDLLFPLIAQSELTKRLGNVNVRAFSYNAKKQAHWPYEVTSIAELVEVADTLDGVLIGGGFVIRFDKQVAPHYYPPTPSIHHPTGYWLTPALMATGQGIPLIWNAPGMHCNEIPSWAEPLMKLTLEHSSYIAVRDDETRKTLAPWANGTPINVMPDTAFGISQLVPTRALSPAFAELRKSAGLDRDYIIIQGIAGMKPYLKFLQQNPDGFGEFRFLVLPIGPVLGDNEKVFNDLLPNLVQLSFWPDPLLMAELIGHASAVMGHSYHLMITALAFGVPVFGIADMKCGKYTALAKFRSLYSLTDETDPEWFRARLGKSNPSEEILDALDQLSGHWDRTAAAICEGATKPCVSENRFWEAVPGLLEDSAQLRASLQLADADIELRDQQLAAILDSPSWKATAPARFLMRKLKQLTSKGSR